ncbi:MULTISPECIES: hypothetical protein [Mycolicibacterium]|uniref:Uncharacterized protein n=1 Tax=Mycolicibacterium porcinum TaxID=39693 RepID=A0ABV3VEL4_9MYCO
MTGEWWCSDVRKSSRHITGVTLACVASVLSMMTGLCGLASADPSTPPPPPLPVFVPTASGWTPKVPYSHEATQKYVTEADINAEREMCQWFNAQYLQLRRQMDDFGFDLLHSNNDWTVPGIQAHADAVASNIEQTVAFLSPRTESLTQSQDHAGDVYFPLYQGESFYRLWQHLANTGVGIRARNTAWVYGPSQQRVKHWGSRIERSHVCD